MKIPHIYWYIALIFTHAPFTIFSVSEQEIKCIQAIFEVFYYQKNLPAYVWFDIFLVNFFEKNPMLDKNKDFTQSGPSTHLIQAIANDKSFPGIIMHDSHIVYSRKQAIEDLASIQTYYAQPTMDHTFFKNLFISYQHAHANNVPIEDNIFSPDKFVAFLTSLKFSNVEIDAIFKKGFTKKNIKKINDNMIHINRTLQSVYNTYGLKNVSAQDDNDNKNDDHHIKTNVQNQDQHTYFAHLKKLCKSKPCIMVSLTAIICGIYAYNKKKTKKAYKSSTLATKVH